MKRIWSLFDKKITTVIAFMLFVLLCYLAATLNHYYGGLASIPALIVIISIAKQNGAFDPENDTHDW